MQISSLAQTMSVKVKKCHPMVLLKKYLSYKLKIHLYLLFQPHFLSHQSSIICWIAHAKQIYLYQHDQWTLLSSTAGCPWFPMILAWGISVTWFLLQYGIKLTGIPYSSNVHDFIHAYDVLRGPGNIMVSVSSCQAGHPGSRPAQSAWFRKVEFYHNAINLFLPVPTTGSPRPSMCYHVYVIMHIKDF